MKRAWSTLPALFGVALGSVFAAAATPEQRVLAVAREQLVQQAARAGWIEPMFDMTLAKSGRPTPACSQNVAVEDLDTRYPSRMRFVAICPDADGWRLDLIVRASVSARVLVATNDLPSGRPLTDADVALERRNVTATPDALSDLQATAGMASRRAIRSGDTVRRSLLTVAMLVRRGDAVRIVARSGPVEVTVAGEALDAGGRGDVVRVRNVANGNVISTRVTGSGTVEPETNVPMPVHSAD